MMPVFIPRPDMLPDSHSDSSLPEDKAALVAGLRADLAERLFAGEPVDCA